MANKNCGKKDRNELHLWNFKIGRNNKIQQNKNCVKIFALYKYKGKKLKKLHVWRINIAVKKI